MGNHPPDFVSPQNQVSQKLSLPVSFLMAEGTSTGYTLLPHEISQGCIGIHIRRFCRLSVACDPLATVISKHNNSELGDFAVAIEAGKTRGRVVAVGSAGHIASKDDSRADQYSTESNSRWTLNMITWLAGITHENV